MNPNQYVVSGLAVVILAVFFGVPLFMTKSQKSKTLLTVIVWVLGFAGFMLAAKGLNERERVFQKVRVSQEAEVVQKLLRGEGVPIEKVRAIGHYLNIARNELKVSPEVLARMAEPSRYSLRFDTNGVPARVNP